MAFFQRGGDPLSLACAIGSRELKMIAFRASAREKTATLVSHRTRALPYVADSEVHFSNALLGIGEFIDFLAREAREKVRFFSCSLPYSFTHSEIRRFRFIRPLPQMPMDAVELRELCQEALSAAHRGEREDGGRGANQVLLAAEVEGVLADDRRVGGDARFSAREVIVLVIRVSWTKRLAEALSAFCRNRSGIKVRVFPRLFLARDYFLLRAGRDASGVLFDIDHDESALLVFSRGELSAFRAFAFGGASIQQERRGGKESWSDAWRAFLEEVSQESAVAPQFYLSGAGALAPALPTVLAEPQWFRSFAAGDEAEVSLLAPDEREKRWFPHWPLETARDTVLFSLVSRMIQATK